MTIHKWTNTYENAHPHEHPMAGKCQAEDSPKVMGYVVTRSAPYWRGLERAPLGRSHFPKVGMSRRSEAWEDLGKSIEELTQRPQARNGPGVLEE